MPPVIFPVADIVLVDNNTPDTSTLPPVMLPETDTVVPVKLVALTLAPPKTLPPVMLPVTLILLPVITPPTTDAPVMVPVTLTVVPVWVVALTLAPPKMLPALMLAVVVIFEVELIADITFELRLSPAAFKLPAVMLPVVENDVAINVPIMLPPEILAVVVMLAADTKADTTFELRLNPAAFKLPPVMLPVTLTVVPVKLVALTLAPPKMLPPEILAVVVMLAADTRADTTLPLKLKPAAFKLPPVMLPVTLTLVPVAAPILGVVNTAPVLTMMLPVPSNAVVMLSVLAENTVPFSTRPAEVLAEYVPAPENCVNTTLLVPIITLSVVCTQPVSAKVAPDNTNKKSPPLSSLPMSSPTLRVSTLLLV